MEEPMSAPGTRPSPSTERTGRTVRLAAAALTLALVPVAFVAAPATATDAPSPSTSAGRAATTFIVGTTQDIDSLNPFKGVVQTAYEVYFLLYDNLTGWSQRDLSPAPTGLAKSWEKSTDGKTWTYHLHEGAKWSDGTPLTANDVAYTFNRVLTNEDEGAPFDAYISTITKVTATNATTVVMETSAPTPVMEQLWVPILPEHIWKNITPAQVADFENKTPVGSGPFSLAEYRPTEFLRFRANKAYFGGAPKVDEVVLRVFANAETMALALRNGEIDLAHDLPATQFESMKNQPGITTVVAKSRDFNEIAFNVGAATADNEPIGDGHPALRDKRVRQAIGHAIDRKTLVQRVLQGYGDTATGVIPAMYGRLHYAAGDKERAFDLAEANRILDEAGYAKGTDGIRTMPGGGRKLQFRLYGRQGSASSEQTVQFVAEWLRQIGLAIDLKIISEDQLTTFAGEGNFDIFEWGWGVEPDPNFMLSVFTCGQRSIKDGDSISAGWSDSYYCNPAYDALYEQQKTVVDQGQRADLVKQMQAMLYDDAPYVMTYYSQILEAYRSDRFTNLQRQPAEVGQLVFQFGAYTYRSVTPVSESSASRSGGPSTGLLVGVGLGVLALVAAVVVLVLVRRRSADVRE
jgi:peptide/nickel transport system substrate-binding protein